jgi:dTDP-4-dehydrorhamnose 3,5-epimerase-like enzyme
MRTKKDERGENYWDIVPELPGQLNVVYSNEGVKRGLHRHQEITETFFITNKSFKFHLDGKEWTVYAGDRIVVKPNMWHGLEALQNNASFMYYQTSKFNEKDEEIKEWL